MHKPALIAAVLGVLLGILALLAHGFWQRGYSTWSATNPTAAVVFTGQFNRVNAALRLFEDGKITRLFISGVNPGAGIEATTFADQFNLSPRVRQALHTGQITLGERAGSTLENARETACWLQAHPEQRTLTLITGATHMPRASLALERAVGKGVSITRYTVPTQGKPPLRRWMSEFGKFAATAVVTLAPAHWWQNSRACPSP